MIKKKKGDYEKEIDPLYLPEDPFDYISLLKQKEGIGFVGNHTGKKIAIIGAGCSGLSAAYELMRIGLCPIIYEATDRIGGRIYSYRFKKDNKAIAELGAMRIPKSHKTVFYYLDKFNLKYLPFRNPVKQNTMLYVEGNKYLIKNGKLPAKISLVKEKWNLLINPILEKMDEANSDSEKRAIQWGYYVNEYKDKSFFQVLNEAKWTRDEIDLLGNLGVGMGGLDSFYQTCFLEILRTEIHKDEKEHMLVVGGLEQLPKSLWEKEENCRYWDKTSLKKINNGKPRPAATEINLKGNKILTKDLNGKTEEYSAVIVTCSLRALETSMKIDRDIFDHKLWTAIYDLPMVEAQKIFLLTKNAFWKNGKNIHTTFTDMLTRQMYLFDKTHFGTKTKSGVILLSYTWGGSSAKLNALSKEQKIKACLRVIEEIYGKEIRETIEKQTMESIVWSWENSYGFNGAFRMTNPGQYENHWLLFNQGRGRLEDKGVYLAGEALSWLGLSGWIEGAIHSGIRASLAVINRLNNEKIK